MPARLLAHDGSLVQQTTALVVDHFAETAVDTPFEDTTTQSTPVILGAPASIEREIDIATTNM